MRRTVSVSAEASREPDPALVASLELRKRLRTICGECHTPLWNRKVALLGRTAATARLDQHAYHLFHPSSAGYPNHAAHASNPHYAHNVWLLRRVSSIRDAREFLRQFPPPAHRPRPWDEQRRRPSAAEVDRWLDAGR